VKNTAGAVALLTAGPPAERLRLSGKPYGEGAAVRFSADGDHVVDGSWQGDLLVRSASIGEVVLHKTGSSVTRMTATADRLTWAYLTRDGCLLRRWPFTDHQPTVLQGDPVGLIATIALAPEGTRLAAADGRALQVLGVDGSRLELLAEVELPISGTGDALAWRRDGATLAYAGADHALVFTPELTLRWKAGFE
jgi:hypothetical protein